MLMKKFISFCMILLLTGLAAQAKNYEINVGGVEVTSSNASYISGKDIKSGYATYDEHNNTLTLHNITIIRDSGTGNYALHNRDCSGLKIRCEGTCNLSTVTAHTIHMDKTTKIEAASGAVLNVKMTGATSSSTAALYSKNNSDVFLLGPGRINVYGYGIGSYYPSAIRGEGSNPYLYFDNNSDVYIYSHGYTIYNYKLFVYSGSDIELGCYSGYNVFNYVSGLNLYGNEAICSPADAYLSNGTLYNGSTSLYISDDYGLILSTANFPDANFRNAMREYYPKQYLTKSELQYLTSINVGNKGISNMKGVEKLTYLKKLYCYNNSITSLDLSSNAALTYLSCYNNEMTSLNVNNCTNLTYLDCAPNNLTSLNVSNLSKLESLFCYNNKLTSLNLPSSSSSSLNVLRCYNNKFTSLLITNYAYLTELNVSNNTSMTSLYCYGNKLSSLDVTGCTALTDLRCYGSNNTFSYLDLTGTTALTYLDCGPCPNLSSITNLSNCTRLQTLICYTTKISNLNSVDNMNKLESLDCHNTKITSLTLTSKNDLSSVNCSNCPNLSTANIQNNPVLTTLKCNDNSALTSLNCVDNKLATLNVTNCPSLKKLYCYNNSSNIHNTFTTLDLTGTTALTNLVCPYNPSLSSITNLGSCTAMKELECNNTVITSLDVSNMSNLESLKCSHTKLTSLTLSNKSKLTTLYCTSIPTMTSLSVTGTQLNILDVQGNTGLTTLNCYSNASLNSISGLSACTNLATLSCYSCNLSSLNVSALTKLQTLKCYNNKLTSLKVQGCTALKTIECYKNKITGSGMTTLVNSLPTRSSSAKGTLRAIYNTGESNTMTTAQITIARNKYWTPYKFNGSSWIEMTGIEDKIWMDDVDGDPGVYVNVPVTLQNSEPVQSIEFDVYYPTGFTALASKGERLTQGSTVTNATTSGYRHVSIANTTTNVIVEESGSGVICYVRVKAPANTGGSYELSLRNINLVLASGSKTLSNCTSTFNVLYTKGDVNGDQEVNIADVNCLIKVILGQVKAEFYEGRAYVNDDDEVNIADVNAVINIILNH